MEINIFCITLGLIMAVLLVGIGVQLGRCDKGQSDRDNDGSDCDHVADRDRGSMDRHTPEEMSLVLYHMRESASRYEKSVVDQIIEALEEMMA